ncbi:MAG: carboxypeptidase-like regulatory domain-containing protein [Planctomycetaceae bacterium]
MSISFLKRAAVWFACVGVVVPQVGVAAESAVRPMDLRLSGNATLAGQVVDDQGKPLRTDVLVTYGGMVVARAKTNVSGRFAITGMRGGVHQIVAGNGSTLARVWSGNTAPASAKTAALLVRGKVVRSQGCGESGCLGCTDGSCGAPIAGHPMILGEGCAPGGCGGGILTGAGGGLFSGAGAGTGGLLLSGLVVGGVAAAIAVAADDDDDAPASP